MSVRLARRGQQDRDDDQARAAPHRRLGTSTLAVATTIAATDTQADAHNNRIDSNRPRNEATNRPPATAISTNAIAYRLTHPRLRFGSATRFLQSFGEVGHEVRDGEAFLSHRVAFAHGDGAILERVEIDRDAEGRADLVLTAVPTPDRAGVVVVAHPFLLY